MLTVKVHFEISVLCTDEQEAVASTIEDFNRIINGLKTQNPCTVKYLLVEEPKIKHLSFEIDGLLGYRIRWKCLADKESFERLLLWWEDHDQSKLRMYNLHLGDMGSLF